MTDDNKPLVHFDPSATQEQKQSVAPLLDVCPKCGAETNQGFGLAGGGYGVYAYCPTETCDYFAKMQVED